MAVKNYIVKNKKKNLCILLALIVAVVSVFTIKFAKPTNASVYRNEDGAIVRVDHINILEIVAREGQQVLGYTVEGQEPIKKSDIESYQGPMNLSDEEIEEFENLTGYKIVKSAHGTGDDAYFTYTVDGKNTLNNTFNDNVLGQNMNAGEITVKAVQASNVRVSDVQEADLIYINSNDSSANLLYYYDQFVNKGSLGIERGDIGGEYDSEFSQTGNKLNNAVTRIVRAAGYSDRVSYITYEDLKFIKEYYSHNEIYDADNINVRISLGNYYTYNYDAYMKKIAELEEGYFSDDIAKAVNQLNELMAQCNITESNELLNKVNSNIGENFDDEKLNDVISALSQVNGYLEVNNDEYIFRLRLGTLGNFLSVQNLETFLGNINGMQASAALEELKTIKGNVTTFLSNNQSSTPGTDPTDPTDPSTDPTDPTDPSTDPTDPSTDPTDPTDPSTDPTDPTDPSTDPTDPTDPSTDPTDPTDPADPSTDPTDPSTIEEDNGLSKYGLTTDDYDRLVVLFKTINLGTIYDDIMMDYLNDFFDTKFEYSGASDSEKMRTLISDRNKIKAEGYLEDFAAAAGDSEKFNAFADKADGKLKLIAEMYSLEDYNECYVEKYLSELENLSAGYFLNTAGQIDTEKINAFFKDVNAQDYIETLVISGDLTWKAAMEIYKRASEGEVGLMYNTQLLTKGDIGDYSVDYIAEQAKAVEENENGGSEEKDALKDNTNNVYKMLLLLRQIRYSYYLNSLEDKIDENGVYYAEAQEDGTGVSSWWKGTFGTDYDNHVKYREPDVVGLVYNETDNVVGDTNYIDRRIYSFTGSQMYGGRQFTVGSDTVALVGVVTTPANYSVGSSGSGTITDRSKLETDNWVLVNTTDSGWSGLGDNIYAHIWGSGTYPTEHVPLVKETTNNYALMVPTGFTQLLFTPAANYGNKTYDYDARSQLGTNNRLIKIRNDYGRYAYNDTSSTYIIAGIKNSIRNGTVEFVENPNDELRFWSYSRGSVYAQYRLYVGDTIVSSPNANGYHYTWTGSETFTLNDKIEILDNNRVKIGNYTIELKDTSGNQLSLSSAPLKIQLTYFTYNDYQYGRSVTKEYSYLRRSNYKLNIENFISNGVVDYYGNMDVKVDYEGIDEVRYSFNGAQGTIANGGSVNLGSNLDDGERKQLTIEYKLTGDTAYNTISTTLNKLEQPQGDKNYLSYMTASNNESLSSYRVVDSSVPSSVLTGSKGDVIKYLLNVVTDVVQNLPVRVLEIQPASMASDFGVYGTTRDQMNGIKKILDYMKIDVSNAGIRQLFAQSPDITNMNINNVSNYKKLVEITTMSVKEFNTHENELTADYDIIYIGANIGPYRLRDDNGRTTYNDASMNGQVYTGIGDRYQIQPFMAGSAASDYVEIPNTLTGNRYSDQMNWKRYYSDGLAGNANSSWNLWSSTDSGIDKTTHTYALRGTPRNANNNSTESFYTRTLGTDLTVERMEDLLEYLKSGYALLLDDRIMYCDDDSRYVPYNPSVDSSRWTYVGTNSKMYNFIVQAKALGYDTGSDSYTGVVTAADGTVQNVFSDGKTYPSMVAVSNAKSGKNPESLSGRAKLNGGLSYAYNRVARVQFKLVEYPTKYDETSGRLGNVISQSSDQAKQYEFKLDIQTAVSVDWMQENYEYMVYVDKSGIGKFVDKVTYKLSPKVTYSEDGKSVTLTGNWPSNIEGFVPWKVEAYNKSNPKLKFSETGFSAFTYKETKDVYVLWLVTPNSQNPGATSNSSDSKFNLNFRSLVDRYDSQIINSGYRIHILAMSYESFSDYYTKGVNDGTKFDASNTKLKVKQFYEDYFKYNYAYKKCLSGPDFGESDIRYLNYRMGSSKNSFGKDDSFANNLDPDMLFDMIVFGFNDSPSGADIYNVAALNDINWFVGTAKKSLLFSHDGTSYQTSINNYTSTGSLYFSGNQYRGDNNWRFGKYMTSGLRTLIGQDTFGIMRSEADINANVNKDNFVNSRKYINTSDQSDYRGYSEYTTMNYSVYNVGSKQGFNTTYSLDGKTLDSHPGNWPRTTRVIKLNKGQITQYPFVLGDTLTVGLTHTQYLALNLEDEDTTVWYTLDSPNTATQIKSNEDMYSRYYGYYNKGDGANNYYIYTNGNVTFSSAGHDTTTEDDNLLFINTVIFAIKAGNFAPELELLNGYEVDGETKVEYYEEDGAQVSFVATDFDGEDNAAVFTDCKIFIDIDGDGKYGDGDILLNDPSDVNSTNTYLSDASGNPINITSENLLNRVDKTFYLTPENLQTLNNKIGQPDVDGVPAICNYNFVIKVTDDGNSDAVVQFKLDYKAGAKEKKYFNLN